MLVSLSNKAFIVQKNKYEKNYAKAKICVDKTGDKFIPAFKGTEILTKDSKEFKKINQIYQEVAKMPATFLSNVYNYAGEKDKSPEIFRDNTCIGLGNRLKDKLAKNGYKDSYFVPLEGSRHHLLVSNIKNNWFLFDASWSTMEPANLTEIFNSPTKKGGVNMLPVLYDKDGNVILQSYMYLSYPDKNNSNKIEMQMKSSNLSAKGGIYDLEKRFQNRPIRTVDNIYTQSQSTLEIKVQNISKGEKNYLVYPVAKYFDEKINNPDFIYIKDSAGQKHPYGSNEFKKYLGEMGQILKLEASKILDYMTHGVDLFYKNAPEGFKFIKKI